MFLLHYYKLGKWLCKLCILIIHTLTHIHINAQAYKHTCYQFILTHSREYAIWLGSESTLGGKVMGEISNRLDCNLVF